MSESSPPAAPLSDQDLELLLSSQKESASSLAEDLLAQFTGDLLDVQSDAAPQASSAESADGAKGIHQESKEPLKGSLVSERLLGSSPCGQPRPGALSIALSASQILEGCAEVAKAGGVFYMSLLTDDPTPPRPPDPPTQVLTKEQLLPQTPSVFVRAPPFLNSPWIFIELTTMAAFSLAH